MLDCDDLKTVNDALGHPAGHGVLQLVARAMKTAKRLGDVAGRLGGDEFVVLVPETDADGAAALAARLLRHLDRERLEDGRVTASVRIGSFPDDGRTADRRS
jgi:diguanylate cyclase (GGDEF)-like protein